MKIKAIGCLFCLFISTYCYGDEGGALELLITAKATKAKYLKSNSKVNSRGELILVAPSFSFTFTDIKIRQGDYYKLPKEMNLELEARQEEAILKADAVYLYLKVENGVLKVEDWGIVSSFVCRKEKNIDPRYKDSYFYLTEESKRMGEKCSYIRHYHDKPE